MKIVRDIYGEKIPEYDSHAERMAAIAAYLRGDYGSLTALEVTFFRSCEEDPNNVRWEAEHAGCLPEGFTQFDVDGALFVNRPASEPLEKSREWLRDQIGPHPMTPLNVYLALKNAQGEGARGLAADFVVASQPALRSEASSAHLPTNHQPPTTNHYEP